LGDDFVAHPLPPQTNIKVRGGGWWVSVVLVVVVVGRGST